MTVFIETISCLSRRTVPTIRVKILQPDRVDRSIGLTRSLSPMLYDICVTSNAFLHHSDKSDIVMSLKDLGELNSRLEA
jgi:hypothetical protein